MIEIKKFSIISLLTIITLFSSIISNLNNPKIGLSNFEALIKNSTEVWAVAVINGSEPISKEYISIYENVQTNFTNVDVNYGIIDLNEEDGKKLLDGINIDLPTTLIFNDINNFWTDLKSTTMTSKEHAIYIEFNTRLCPKNDLGKPLKVDIDEANRIDNENYQKSQENKGVQQISAGEEGEGEEDLNEELPPHHEEEEKGNDVKKDDL